MGNFSELFVKKAAGAEALRLIKAWGFTYKSVAFVWLKKNRKSEGWFYGLGFWTRGNAEVCLLATRGHPKRQAANIHQFIISPIQEHSRKPEEAREKIVALMGDVPRVELFARQSPPGWDVWGNEVESTIPDFWTKCPEVATCRQKWRLFSWPGKTRRNGGYMQFFSSAIDTLQTLVVALGAGLGVWGVVNLLEGYGSDNPGSKSQGMKQLMAGGGIILLGTTLIPLLSGLF